MDHQAVTIELIGDLAVYRPHGKVRKTTTGSRKDLEGGFVIWRGSWELFDLPRGVYTVELKALDKEGKVVTSRTDLFLHENPPSPKRVLEP